LTPVRQTCTMFYVEKLFSFLRRHFLQNSLFGFRQLGGSAAVLSGCLPSQGKSPPLRSGWLSFLLRIVLCLLPFASFCFAIVIVCAPNPFFLSLFALFLVACWLLLICRLQTSGGSIPWLQSSAVLFLSPVPWPQRCSCSVPSLASAVLGSSASPWCSFLAPHLIAFNLVLRTKPSASPRGSSSASPRCSPLVPRCSARNLRPRSLPRPQRSSVLRPRFGAPPRLLAFSSVLHSIVQRMITQPSLEN
jgi:hypothetical protein